MKLGSRKLIRLYEEEPENRTDWLQTNLELSKIDDHNNKIMIIFWL